MSCWRSFKTTQCRRQRLLTSVFTSLNAVQCEQLDSGAATQCTKRANSMNVSRSFFRLWYGLGFGFSWCYVLRD